MFDWRHLMTKKKTTKKSKGMKRTLYVPKLSKTKHTDWCDETTSYQLKVDLVTFNNKKYMFRYGTGSLGFISMHKNDFTIVHIYRLKDSKKVYVSTKRFSDKLSWRRVKEIIFKKSINVSDAKKNDLPYKTLHKQLILPIEDFKKKFKPNMQTKKSYTSTGKDTALVSLGKMLEEESSFEMSAGTLSAGLNNVMKSINYGINSYNGSLPAVSTYAIWSNYDPESRLINNGKFDIGEPVMYEYQILKKKKNTKGST